MLISNVKSNIKTNMSEETVSTTVSVYSSGNVNINNVPANETGSENVLNVTNVNTGTNISDTTTGSDDINEYQPLFQEIYGFVFLRFFLHLGTC